MSVCRPVISSKGVERIVEIQLFGDEHSHVRAIGQVRVEPGRGLHEDRAKSRQLMMSRVPEAGVSRTTTIPDLGGSI